MKEARRVAILVCIVLLCSIQGCDTYEFGDQAKDFVEKEAYGYSKRLAEADLKSRWPNFFVSALVETGLSLDAVFHNLVNVEALVDHSPKFDERAAVTQLIFYDRSMPVLRENQQRI